MRQRVFVPIPLSRHHLPLIGYHHRRAQRRPPGIDHTSPTFQQALQIEVIAFTPVEGSPTEPRTPKYMPAHNTSCGNTSEHKSTREDIECDGIARMLNGTRGNESIICRATTFSQGSAVPGAESANEKGERRSRRPKHVSFTWSEAERRLFLSQVLDFSGKFTTSTAISGRPKRLGNVGIVLRTPSPPQPAEYFDSSDMIMVAGLLAHPESSVKVYHIEGRRVFRGSGLCSIRMPRAVHSAQRVHRADSKVHLSVVARTSDLG